MLLQCIKRQKDYIELLKNVESFLNLSYPTDVFMYEILYKKSQ